MGCARVPVTLLNGATGTGAGSTVDLGQSLDTFSYVLWSTSGGAGASSVNLEGSQDGSNWFTLTAPQVPGGSLSSGRVSQATHVRYIRGNCTAHIGGGAALTMTVVPA